jgi:hypothetical protein
LSEDEREALEAGLRSSDAFFLRRCQILLASDRGENAYQIARSLGCNPQTARNAIHRFNQGALQEALQKGSSRAHIIHRAFDSQGAERLREMLHQSPRDFGKPTSLWALELAAEASLEEGLTEERVSGETIRATLARELGVRWQRAKRWITSPDPAYERKRRRNRLMCLTELNEDRVLGFEDEVWWSRRLAVPSLHSFSEKGKPLRLVQQSVAKDDPDPKAISCYGLYLPELEETWLRFVDGRPVSGITTRFLSWSLGKLAEVGKKKVLVSVWDNASWHISHEVRRWIDAHNREVKKSGGKGVRIISCFLPKQSPWLNAIEPKWVHGKRRVVEADGVLTAHELAERVCAAFDCPHHEHLSIPEKVA